jgi:hypothetical protein
MQDHIYHRPCQASQFFAGPASVHRSRDDTVLERNDVLRRARALRLRAGSASTRGDILLVLDQGASS